MQFSICYFLDATASLDFGCESNLGRMNWEAIENQILCPVFNSCLFVSLFNSYGHKS